MPPQCSEYIPSSSYQSQSGGVATAVFYTLQSIVIVIGALQICQFTEGVSSTINLQKAKHNNQPPRKSKVLLCTLIGVPSPAYPCHCHALIVVIIVIVVIVAIV